jgi:hypothetical protein
MIKKHISYLTGDVFLVENFPFLSLNGLTIKNERIMIMNKNVGGGRQGIIK